MTSLIFQPLIPASLWLVLLAAGALMLTWYATIRPDGMSRTRWSTVITLMSASLAVVLVVLLNPTWSRQIRTEGGKPTLDILVDGSKSMATPDAEGGITRFSAAAAVAIEMNESLATDFDVRVDEFDRSVKSIDPAAFSTTQPTGSATDLARAIASVFDRAQSQGQAIVLLSDGIHNTSAVSNVLESARLARSFACPIYTRTFGGSLQSIIVAVKLKSAQDLAIVGQKLPISVTVTHQGVSMGRTSVSLLLDGKQIDRRDVIIDPKGPSDVHFMVSQEKVGVYPYEVRVEPFPGQTALGDITASYTLRIVDEPIRVLVLEGKPYWDSKFFIRTLANDPAVAMDAITRISSGRLMQRSLTHKKGADGGAPAADMVETWKIVNDAKAPLETVDKLRGYQIVVLGRDVDDFLSDTAITNLQTWISQLGGSLVCYRGSPTQQKDQRLAKLLPIDFSAATASRFHVAMTPQGRDLNWLTTFSDDPLPRMPTLAASDSVGSVKPLAVVLASSTLADGTSEPTVVYHPYGTGRVLAVEGEGMWHWAFLPPEYQQQEQVYSSLWNSMMRWLTSGANLRPGQSASLRADRTRFSTEESATATLLVREENGKDKVPSVELTESNGTGAKTFTAAPMGEEAGVFRLNFGNLSEGRYQAKIIGAKDDDPATRIIFDVHKYDREEVDLQARPDLMERIASDSGGSVLSPGSEIAAVRAKFAENLARTHPPQIEYASAWDYWWLLGGALALWTVSWIVRRTGSLI
jgi:hypothetical protein